MTRIVIQSLPFGAVMALAVLFFTCWAINVPGYYRMAHGPGFAEGTVTNKQPENHRHVGYTFTVGNQSYSGEGAVGDTFDRIRPGDKVRVTYDRRNPSLSMLMGSASDIYKQATLMSAIFALLMGFPSGIVVFLLLRSIRQQFGHFL